MSNFKGYFRNFWLKYATGVRNAEATVLEDEDYMILLRDDAAAGEIDIKVTVGDFKETIIAPPLPHAASHEIGGTDEVNIDGGAF